MKYYQLTEEERYQIYAFLKAGKNQKQIAEELKRSPATISRELSRNTGLRGYRPKQAQISTLKRRSEASKFIKMTPQVIEWVRRLIEQELSPQQTVDYLKTHKNIALHHETIYQWIYQDKKQGGDLYTHLRIASKPYRKRYGSYDKRGKIQNRVDIDERPDIVDKRTRIGDWEGDTVIGKGRKGAILTMVERKTLYTVIAKLNGKNAKELAAKTIEHMGMMTEEIKTITYDNGLEFAAHEDIAKGLEADIYFAHPYASWQRGMNENTNGLIRQYFPKDTNFQEVTEAEIAKVMEKLNNRPRKSRGGKSPNELFKGQRVDLLAA